MPCYTPGILLRIPDDSLEAEWRRDMNITHWRGDVWWYAGLMLWTLSTYRRWGGDPYDLAMWFTVNLASCLFPLAVLAASPSTYRNRRLSLLVTTRLVRVAGVFLFITPNQNSIWPAPVPSAICGPSFFLSQLFKLAYLVCQSLAHAVPLKHHAWLMALNAATTLISVPPRCAFDCGVAPELGSCAVTWLGKLRAALEPLWIISIESGNASYGEMEPSRACMAVQSWVMLTLGVTLPLLCFATVEEGWKTRFLAERVHPRVTPRVAIAIAYDLAVAAASAVVILQAVLLFLPP